VLILLLLFAASLIVQRRNQGDKAPRGGSTKGDGANASADGDLVGEQGRHGALKFNPDFVEVTYDVPNIPSKANNEESHFETSVSNLDQLDDLPLLGSKSACHVSNGRTCGDENADFYQVMATGEEPNQSSIDDNGNNAYDVGAPLIRASATNGVNGARDTHGDNLRNRSLPPRNYSKRSVNRSQAVTHQQADIEGVRCQRPSPKGGTCKKVVTSGGQFCTGHTCPIDGCGAGKSSAVMACAYHHSMATINGTIAATLTDVTVKDAYTGGEDNVPFLVPCGGNFYELPQSNMQDGGTTLYQVSPGSVDDASPSTLRDLSESGASGYDCEFDGFDDDSNSVTA
jgi:hypothetical protein